MRKGDLVPVCFMLMSRRTARDYKKKVFKEIFRIAGPELQVQEFVLDLERAIWRGVEDVFPNVSMFGCVFHWAHAVFRQLKQLGLVYLLNRKTESYVLFLKKVLSLHLLPFEKISKAFAELRVESLKLPVNVTQADLISKFFKYVEKQWISNPIWPTSKWASFNQKTRTNNDAKGWHNRVNIRTRQSDLNFYELITMLYDSAKTISLQAKLLCQGIDMRQQRIETSELHSKLFSI